MDALQIIETIRDTLGDLERIEDKRADRFIELNQGNADAIRERNMHRVAYDEALHQVNRRLTELRRNLTTQAGKRPRP